uniref:Uncharacterized protein n=1 Tax=Otus sunia TaxID=257818 RepID=A0A8C8AU75_9STRI
LILYIPLLLCYLRALYFCAASPPTRKAPTAPLSLTCDDTAVEEAADLALRQIKHPQISYLLITGSVFYLILDVVDTECHVLSKKLRKRVQRIYGQYGFCEVKKCVC